VVKERNIPLSPINLTNSLHFQEPVK